jgi:hypothetical protein
MQINKCKKKKELQEREKNRERRRILTVKHIKTYFKTPKDIENLKRIDKYTK